MTRQKKGEDFEYKNQAMRIQNDTHCPTKICPEMKQYKDISVILMRDSSVTFLIYI